MKQPIKNQFRLQHWEDLLRIAGHLTSASMIILSGFNLLSGEAAGTFLQTLTALYLVYFGAKSHRENSESEE